MSAVIGAVISGEQGPNTLIYDSLPMFLVTNVDFSELSTTPSSVHCSSRLGLS